MSLRVKKRCFCVLLVLILAFTAVPLQVVSANSTGTPIGIMPLWDNVNSITPSLSISNAVATCSVTVIGRPGTTRITAVVYLQQRNSNGTWSSIRTWSGISTNSSILTWSGTHPVTAGQTYRMRVDATVTRNGTNETVTVFSAERWA
jgi:hypothetical protein